MPKIRIALVGVLAAVVSVSAEPPVQQARPSSRGWSLRLRGPTSESPTASEVQGQQVRFRIVLGGKEIERKAPRAKLTRKELRAIRAGTARFRSMAMTLAMAMVPPPPRGGAVGFPLRLIAPVPVPARFGGAPGLDPMRAMLLDELMWESFERDRLQDEMESLRDELQTRHEQHLRVHGWHLGPYRQTNGYPVVGWHPRTFTYPAGHRHRD